MSIDISRETIITMAQAARRLPNRTSGRPIHVATLYRWAGEGVHGVRLETVKIGGHKFTSVQAIGRFVAELTRRQRMQDEGLDGSSTEGGGR